MKDRWSRTPKNAAEKEEANDRKIGLKTIMARLRRRKRRRHAKRQKR